MTSRAVVGGRTFSSVDGPAGALVIGAGGSGDGWRTTAGMWPVARERRLWLTVGAAAGQRQVCWARRV